MTLYFDSKVKFSEPGIISTIVEWHLTDSLLAVASYSQNKGGFITIFDETGEPVEGSEDAAHAGQQASALSWHPTRALLAAGWEAGALRLWRAGAPWQPLQAPHCAPPLLFAWSEAGGRLVVADAAGAVTGWKTTPTGLLTAYHLTLDEPLTHVAYCPVGVGVNEGILRGLAKAAVNGDEGALDVLASWRPRTAPRLVGAPTDNHALYAAQQNGNILYIDESGTCSEVLPSVGNVRYMALTTTGSLLVAWEVSGTLNLTRFSIGAVKGALEPKTHVKMSIRAGLGISCAGGTAVAIIAGETSIRIWDSETNDNSILPVEESTPSHSSEMFTSIGYCTFSGALCCGSNQGRVFIWRKTPHGQWSLLNMCSVKGSVKQVCWGSEAGLRPLLAVNSITSVSVLREQPICWGYNRQVWGVQKGPNQVLLDGSKGAITAVKTDISIRAMCLSDTYLAVSDGKEVQILKMGRDTFNFLPIHKFPWQTDTLLLHEDILVGIVGERIESKTISGVSLSPLQSSEGEGEPIGISRTDRYLAIATMDGCIKIAEISRKGLRSPYAPKNCYQLFDDFGEIMYAGVNSAGRLVCLAIATSNLVPEAKLFLWDASSDTLTHIILKGANSEPCIPITICWDAVDPRLVACHVRSTSNDSIRCLFAHNGYLTEHKDWINSNQNQTEHNLCTLNAPYVVTMEDGKLVKTPFNEFVGAEDCDGSTRTHLLDYLYYMTIGQMEQAVVAIGNTGAGETVWRGLARACVPQKRLDVASVCLAKMNDVKGALALHIAMEDPKLNDSCRTAILAIHLNMLDEARQLLEQEGRFDLLARLTAATRGGLEKLTKQAVSGEAALLVKNAYFKLACNKRDAGEWEAAIDNFDKAGVYVPQVPRMLLQANQLALLKHKVATSQNPELHSWWAHYLESQGDLEGALESYEAAGDAGARARLLCHTDRMQDALTLVEKPTAAYYIARHLETQLDKSEEAVKMYMRAGALAAAVRCAAEAGLWELVRRAGSAGAADRPHVLMAATALEGADLAPAAALLYHRAGKLYKAVAVALKAEGESGAEALRSVAESLAGAGSEDCSPELARHLTAPLLTAEQPHTAAIILAKAQLFNEALDLIEEHNIEISDELCEKLTPSKGTDGREQVLRRLADLLGNKGHYHLAAKKLTQAGDKVAAMRWLVKSGDADKIVFFASASRERAVYLMAARALQAADWRTHPALLRRVVALYEKARAPRPLAAFYAACASQEIDEYQNYEKASGALGESLRCLSKSSDPLAASDAVVLQTQADQVQRYLDIEKAFNKGDFQNGMSQGRRLLNELRGGMGVKSPVRPHHLLRLMASKAAAAGHEQDARDYIEQAQALEKSQDMLSNDREGADSPSSDQDVPEYLPEELPTV